MTAAFYHTNRRDPRKRILPSAATDASGAGASHLLEQPVDVLNPVIERPHHNSLVATVRADVIDVQKDSADSVGRNPCCAEVGSIGSSRLHLRNHRHARPHL